VAIGSVTTASAEPKNVDATPSCPSRTPGKLGLIMPLCGLIESCVYLMR
jgi:hypothetical protein